MKNTQPAGGQAIGIFWLFGGTSLTTSLLNAGLIDEFLLAIHPVILGAGKPLFTGISQRKFAKTENQ